MPPRVMPPTPPMAIIPPMTASSTYWRWPRLLFMGPITFVNWLAAEELKRSASFSWSNSSLLFSSWQNTLTTFWPFIISSM